MTLDGITKEERIFVTSLEELTALFTEWETETRTQPQLMATRDAVLALSVDVVGRANAEAFMARADELRARKRDEPSVAW